MAIGKSEPIPDSATYCLENHFTALRLSFPSHPLSGLFKQWAVWGFQPLPRGQVTEADSFLWTAALGKQETLCLEYSLSSEKWHSFPFVSPSRAIPVGQMLLTSLRDKTQDSKHRSPMLRYRAAEWAPAGKHKTFFLPFKVPLRLDQKHLRLISLWDHP